MSIAYKVNVYDYGNKSIIIQGAGTQTESGQGKSVRQVLNEFARDGSFQARHDNRFTYADRFADDQPLDSERMENLLESPDLSQLDPFEVHELVMDNLEEVEKKDDKKEDPPDLEPTQERS